MSPGQISAGGMIVLVEPGLAFGPCQGGPFRDWKSFFRQTNRGGKNFGKFLAAEALL